jgi:hypothetical protein
LAGTSPSTVPSAVSVSGRLASYWSEISHSPAGSVSRTVAGESPSIVFELHRD